MYMDMIISLFLTYWLYRHGKISRDQLKSIPVLWHALKKKEKNVYEWLIVYAFAIFEQYLK